MFKRVLSLVAVQLVFGALAVAQSSEAPPCLASGHELSVNNEQVLQWKTTTKNQYHNRGHVMGTIRQIFSDQTRHHHYEVVIGSNSEDVVEVIYNEEFGGVPNVHVGSSIEACGDYITANAQSGQYPPSPDGALIHWVHMSPRPDRHESGFLVLDGVLCGQDAGLAGPKH